MLAHFTCARTPCVGSQDAVKRVFMHHQIMLTVRVTYNAAECRVLTALVHTTSVTVTDTRHKSCCCRNMAACLTSLFKPTSPFILQLTSGTYSVGHSVQCLEHKWQRLQHWSTLETGVNRTTLPYYFTSTCTWN